MQLAFLLGLLTALPGVTDQSTRLLFDFGPNDSSRWSTVHDTVMGGRSSGTLSRTSAGALFFSGSISLENNGGFASFRSSRIEGDQLGLAGSTGLELRVRGDGRSYILSCDMRGVPIFAGGYWQEFSTVPGEWQTIRFPWEGFVPTNFGREMQGQPALDPARLSGIGIYLYDKRSGDFAIEVDAISAYWAGAADSAAGASTVSFPEDFSTLLRLVESLDLDEALLSLDGQFTLFAPTDDAFQALPDGVSMELARPANAELLKAILLDHVVEGRVPASQAVGLSSATTMQGTELSLQLDANGLKVANATVLATDLEFAGGVVHAVNAVILLGDRTAAPPFAAANPLADCSTVFALVEKAGLSGILADKARYTLFAPTDEAFAALPSEVRDALALPENVDALRAVLLHHVVDGAVTGYAALQLATPFGEAGAPLAPLSGPALKVVAGPEGITIDGATVLSADALVDNAVIHVVNQVLVPSDLKLALSHADPVLAALDASVNRGVESFNAGQFAVCAEGYRTALEALLLYRQIDDASLTARVQRALDQAALEAPRAASWTMRRAIDDVRRSR